MQTERFALGYDAVAARCIATIEREQPRLEITLVLVK